MYDIDTLNKIDNTENIKQEFRNDSFQETGNKIQTQDKKKNSYGIGLSNNLTNDVGSLSKPNFGNLSVKNEKKVNNEIKKNSNANSNASIQNKDNTQKETKQKIKVDLNSFMRDDQNE